MKQNDRPLAARLALTGPCDPLLYHSAPRSAPICPSSARATASSRTALRISSLRANRWNHRVLKTLGLANGDSTCPYSIVPGTIFQGLVQSIFLRPFSLPTPSKNRSQSVAALLFRCRQGRWIVSQLNAEIRAAYRLRSQRVASPRWLGSSHQHALKDRRVRDVSKLGANRGWCPPWTSVSCTLDRSEPIFQHHAETVAIGIASLCPFLRPTILDACGSVLQFPADWTQDTDAMNSPGRMHLAVQGNGSGPRVRTAEQRGKHPAPPLRLANDSVPQRQFCIVGEAVSQPW